MLDDSWKFGKRMEKRKWPWKRKSSESESSESLSSHSERYSDEQEGMKESPSDNLHLLEVTSKATITDDELRESVRSLTEKLSAALVNVSAKEDLVKQHAKVAEEAVAGWEKAENEVTSLKQQLEVALQQNLNLEVKTSHLEGALKECVRQLRQARDEQANQISDALMEKTSEWELIKSDLEKRILDLKAENSASTDPNTLLVLKALERENLSLKEGLVSCCKELEVLTIERDLSTQAAETASKLQLESIKKAAKLEAECRRLQSIASKPNGPELGCLSSRAPALFSGTDQVKNLAVEIDMMDDFLEMERLAALPESGTVSVDNPLKDEPDYMVQRVAELESMLEQMEAEKVELQNALNKAESKMEEVETRLEEVQKELTAVSNAKELLAFQLISMEEESRTLSANADSLNAEIEAERQLSAELRVKCQESEEVETRLEEVQKELTAVTKAKEMLEFQLIRMEEESRTISANVDSLTAEIQTERQLSEELRAKCQELENELTRAIQESDLQQSLNSNGELKIKQEDLAVAADKLSECQKTIASLGRQLQSLATLEDFLIDTSNIPRHSRDSLDSGEIWRLSSNETFVTNSDSRISMENHSYIPNGYRNEDSLRSSSSMPPSTINGTYAKSRNSFGKFFC